MSSPNPNIPPTDVSPWPVGQTTPLGLTLLNDDTSIPNLTGATFTLIIHNLLGGNDLTGAGVFSAWDNTTSLVTYSWDANVDPVATPGNYTLYVIALLPDTTKRIFGPVAWTVVSF